MGSDSAQTLRHAFLVHLFVARGFAIWRETIHASEKKQMKLQATVLQPSILTLSQENA